VRLADLHHHRPMSSSITRWLLQQQPSLRKHYSRNAARCTFSTSLNQQDPETFLTGTTSVYAEQMYLQYQQDPSTVQASWRKYFDNLEKGIAFDATEYNNVSQVVAPQIGAAQSDSLAVAHLIRAYQTNGHRAAQLDPLGVHTAESFPGRPRDNLDNEGFPPELTLSYHGFTDTDLDRPLILGGSSGGNVGYLEQLSQNPRVTLRQTLHELRKTYCGTLAVESAHISDPSRANWLRQRIENPKWLNYDQERKQHIYERLAFADAFESFLAYKFNTTKRFGLDGGEAIVPALKDAIDRATELGAHSFVLGMPHRGRLNVLANVMRKPMPLILSEFQGTHYNVERHTKGEDGSWGLSGDVKYHLGSSMDRTYPDGRTIHLSLVANPSHLECVNPVVSCIYICMYVYSVSNYFFLGRWQDTCQTVLCGQPRRRQAQRRSHFVARRCRLCRTRCRLRNDANVQGARF